MSILPVFSTAAGAVHAAGAVDDTTVTVGAARVVDTVGAAGFVGAVGAVGAFRAACTVDAVDSVRAVRELSLAIVLHEELCHKCTNCKYELEY